jgi:hypothetical protein
MSEYDMSEHNLHILSYYPGVGGHLSGEISEFARAKAHIWVVKEDREEFVSVGTGSDWRSLVTVVDFDRYLSADVSACAELSKAFLWFDQSSPGCSALLKSTENYMFVL